MRLLLDTHLLLWAIADSKQLPTEVRTLLEDESNELYYSAASIWTGKNRKRETGKEQEKGTFFFSLANEHGPR